MVTVTEAAKQELGRILASANVDDPTLGLRLAAGERGQFGLVLDSEKEGDQVVEHEGSKVLLVGQELIELLEGLTIDCQETDKGAHLVISGGKQKD